MKKRNLGKEILQGVEEINQQNKKEKQKNQRLYKTYGITLDDYNRMLSNQGCVCWICGSLPPSGRLCVDHVHVKGFRKMQPEIKAQYVRGLLCFLCNTGLKGFEKTADGQKNRQRLEGTYKYFLGFKLKGEI